MNPYIYIETDSRKFLRSLNTNYNFNKITGFTQMWGRTLEEDILYSDVGPLILDMEISTGCNGVNNKVCAYCYKKENNSTDKNMSLDTFKTILDKMSVECRELTFENSNSKIFVNVPFLESFKVGSDFKIGENTFKIASISEEIYRRHILTQIAIGSGSTALENPELFDMMRYARSVGVIPNITVADVSEDTAQTLSELCGAVAVSKHADKNACYNTIKKLTDKGMKQVNMHFVVHKNSKIGAIDTINDIKNDPRLSKMNAIVFLSLKKKGNGEKLQTLELEGFREIIDYAFEQKIQFGMDSCSGGKFIEVIKDREDFKKLFEYVEPCESTKISSYINVEGKFYSCSFCENSESFKNGIDSVNCSSFVEDVWFNEKTIEWRNNLLKKNSEGWFNCPVFEV